MAIFESGNDLESFEVLAALVDQIILVNLVGEIIEIIQPSHIAQSGERKRESGQSLLAINELVTWTITRNVVKRRADKRPEKVFRFIPTLDERDYIPVEIVPLLFRPRILPLEKRHEELISRVQDFADSFDVSFHATGAGGLRARTVNSEPK